VKESTQEAMKYLAKNLDGKTFTLLNKHLTELRSDVLNNQNHALGPDSFNTFLLKMVALSSMGEHHGHAIVSKLKDVDIALLTPKSLMQQYQAHSLDYQFEKTIRMDEIRNFAQNQVPHPRFHFDKFG
jgi:hypothetical protein